MRQKIQIVQVEGEQRVFVEPAQYLNHLNEDNITPVEDIIEKIKLIKQQSIEKSRK